MLDKKEVSSKIIQIFHKESKDRTQSEREFAAKVLSKNDFFEHHIDKELDPYDIALSLTTSFELEFHTKGTPLITYGDLGDKFYIMVSGRAFVYLPKTEEELTEEKAARKDKGRYMANAAVVDNRANELVQQERSLLRNETSMMQPKLSVTLAQQSKLIRNDSFVSSTKESVRLSVAQSRTKKEENLGALTLNLSQVHSDSDTESFLSPTPRNFLSPKGVSGSPIAERFSQKQTAVQPKSRRGTTFRDAPFFEGNRPTVGEEGGAIKKEKQHPRVTIKLNVHDPDLKHYIEQEMDVNSPRLQGYLLNTPVDNVNYENLLLMTEKKHRKLFIQDGLITQKKTGTMVPGSYFGEKALFGKAMRSATVIAVEDCWLLTLKSKAFSQIFESQQQKTKEKLEFFSKVFSNLWASELKKVIIGFVEVKLDVGRHLFREGDKVDGLYVIKQGEIKLTQNMSYTLENQQNKPFKLQQSCFEIARSSRQALHTVAILGTGQFLGHEEILEKVKERKYTACCTQRDTIVYKMSLKEYRWYMDLHNHPEFIEVIRAAASLPRQWRKNRKEDFCTVQTQCFQSPLRKANFPIARELEKTQSKQNTIKMIAGLHGTRGVPSIRNDEHQPRGGFGGIVEVSEKEYRKVIEKKPPLRIFQKPVRHRVQRSTNIKASEHEHSDYSIRYLPAIKTDRNLSNSIIEQTYEKKLNASYKLDLKIKDINSSKTNLGEQTTIDTTIGHPSRSESVEQTQREPETEFNFILRNRLGNMLQRKDPEDVVELLDKRKKDLQKDSRSQKTSKTDVSKSSANLSVTQKEGETLVEGLMGKNIFQHSEIPSSPKILQDDYTLQSVRSIKLTNRARLVNFNEHLLTN